MGVVREAIEDGVGVGRVSDEFVPFVDRDFAGDDGAPANVALFDNLERISASGGVERLKSPVVKYQQLEAAERPQQSGIATICAG